LTGWPDGPRQSVGQFWLSDLPDGLGQPIGQFWLTS